MSITNDELYAKLSALETEFRDLKVQLSGRSDSIEVNRLTKGYTWSVKVYNNDGEVSLVKAKHLDEELAKTYGGKV